MYIDSELKQNIIDEAPKAEPARQLYFIEECRKIASEISTEKGRELTYCINTFGCQMNAKDSEKLAGIMEQIGYKACETEDADFVLYNTCTVREHANVRVYGRLGVLKRFKDANPDMIIAMCGCMMQEPDVVKKVCESYRHVNIIFGTHNVYMLAELLFYYYCDRLNQTYILDAADSIVEELPSVRKYSFKCGVNIMYGCNNFCSYCIVPYVRGRERSRQPEDILSEIRCVADEGIVEVMLLGQNVNSYAYDFPKLLCDVCHIDKIKRVRFMTSHPKDLSDELIKVIKEEPKVARHIHLPLQSGSTKILRRMNRKYTCENYLELANRIRQEIPGISITTDIIVGFPGETEEDFLDTMDVVRQVQYDSAFTFIYSKRTGTPAAVMPDQVPKDVVQDRFDRLLALCTECSKQQTKKYVGSVQEVLVEGPNPKEEGLLSGRLSNNSVVHFPGDHSLIGTFVKIQLNEAHGFYYTGTMINA